MNAIVACRPHASAECARCNHPLRVDELAARVHGLRGDEHWLHADCVQRISVLPKDRGVADDPRHSARELIDYCAQFLRVRPAVGDVVCVLRRLFPSTEVLVDVSDPLDISRVPTIDDVIERLSSMKDKLASMSQTLDRMQVLLEGTPDA